MRLAAPFQLEAHGPPYPQPPAGERPPGGRLPGLVARTVAAVALAGLALAAAGCSVKQNNASVNLIYGKQQFVAKCGACHTLARANTKGTVGPDLDEAFRYAIAEAHGRSAIRGVVEYQVRYPNPRGVMPRDLAKGAAVSDIAAYVAEAAARPGSDTGLLATAVEPPGAGKPAVEKAGKLQFEANPQGQLAYTTNKATATPGRVTISMRNMSGVTHNLAIQSGTSGPVLGATPLESKGEASISVNLKPGTYTFFCQAPGHRQAGMFGTLTVK
ncbi:MAG TPA: plastocyanin/azurin family copper-binding protein [Solirubrobacteraceae bacterium]|nr:plastocyanin/azurin family copper-binding protein [Solirubrobacteraceae bacterium]